MKKMRDGLRIVGMIAGFLATMPAAVSQAQMSLPGSFEVSDTGAAMYTIPIAVPPGTAGMQPSLSLVYNSQGGNGLLGVGWSLSGLPALTRCPRTIIQDGAVGGVNFDANDRFCLEGQRLIAISGAYAADQTEYRTERESFSKIVSYGTAGTGPAWFKVWTKSGQVMEFGNSADSRIEAQGKTSARLWAVNKISDTKGNTIAVAYAEDNANGDYRPTRVDYTGNAGAGVTPFASVRFAYEIRPDIAPLFEAGSLIITTNRLTSIKTYAGETLVREYRTTYDISPATQRSRIISATVCEATAICLPATVLSIPAATADFSDNNLGDWGGSFHSPQIFSGDYDGDGRTDILYLWTEPNGSYNWRLRLQLPSSQPSDVVASTTSGVGVVTSFTYKPLTDSSIYAKASSAIFPEVDLQAPAYVVSEVQSSDGIGGTYRSTYKYAGARMHVQGRGFLGFESVTAKDEQTLVEQLTTYLQTDPYTGLVASRVKKLGATALNETANTYAQTSLGGTRSFVYLTQSVEKSWELNGSLVSQVTTTHQYDAYGNATQVAVATPDGYSKTTTNTYANDTLNWLLGRLTRASVTSVTP